MIEKLEKYPILIIVIVVSMMLLPGLESTQVSIMEARNFITAREMITDNNWLLTTMNAEPRYEKPPLPTWITAVFSLIFGIENLFFLRLPAVIMVGVVGIFIYLISNLLIKNKAQSLLNGLIAITSFYVFAIIIEAPWDIYTHGFMIGAIYFLLLFLRNAAVKYFLYSSVLISASFLSKGPISFYVLFLPFLLSYSIVYKTGNKNLLKIAGLIGLGLVFSAWWFLYVRFYDPNSFLKIIAEETSNWSNYHVKPFYYYWSFFIQSGIWTIPAFVGLFYPYLKNKVRNKKVYTFSLLWVLFAVILLSIIPEKKSRYLMPVLIPLAINTGCYLEYLIRNVKDIKVKELFIVYFNFGLLALLCLVIPFVGFFFYYDELKTSLFELITVSSLMFILGSSLLYYLSKKEMKRVVYLTFLMVVIMLIFLPNMSAKLLKVNDNYKSISYLKNESLKNNDNVYFLDLMTPELIWDYGDKVKKLTLENAIYQMPKEDDFLVLINNKKLINLEYLKEVYDITLEDTYDLNTAKVGSNKYKRRLTVSCFRFVKR